MVVHDAPLVTLAVQGKAEPGGHLVRLPSNLKRKRVAPRGHRCIAKNPHQKLPQAHCWRRVELKGSVKVGVNRIS